MATFTISVIALTDDAKTKDVFIYEGVQYGFNVGPKGGAAVNNTFVSNTGLTSAIALALIEAKQGLTVQKNPAYADVKTDDGTNGDTTADDGVNQGTRYNWIENGTLYNGTVI